MLRISKVEELEVWNQWKQVENHQDDDFRSDIRNPLPSDLEWYLCEIEPEDIEKLYIISSGDWSDISGFTFLCREVGLRLNPDSLNKDTKRLSKDIGNKIKFQNSAGKLDRKLIAVCDNSSQKDLRYTFIEGNRRSVTFLNTNTLIGNHIYVGYSKSIKRINYLWTRHTYNRIMNMDRFKADIESLGFILQELMEEKYLYNEMIELLNTNKNLSKSNPFLFFIEKSYIKSALITLRALCEKNGKSITMYNLLNDMEIFHSKESHNNIVTSEDLMDDKKVVKQIGDDIESITNRRIVHYDRATPVNYPDNKKINKLINSIAELIKKYYSILLGSDYPKYPDPDYGNIFDFPWNIK